MATREERSDEELMRAYVAGDEAAFRALFDRYAPILFGLARRHLESNDAANEIVQQTFFKLHGARHDFRNDSKLRPWVMTIAMNLMRERWRRHKRRKTSLADDLSYHAAPTPEHTPLETQSRARLLHAALDRLPASQRSVVELHWFQDYPYAEVAKIVGTSEGAVRVRAHRAYKTLKDLLQADFVDE
ncbi:MAG: RNA polymerase sigma factor [Myxococcales bacterium]|nr:RNA polymerase sigma factor [Myxococcales bacterium]